MKAVHGLCAKQRAKCAARKDFGKGFYLTTSRRSAEDFVRASIKKAIAQGLITEDQNFGFVSVFEYHEKDGISKYVYENADADWLYCIVEHRKKNTFSAIVDSVKDYDIVAGKIADDRTNEAFECISFVESEKIWIR